MQQTADREQAQAYERAIALFQSGNFRDAKDLFERASTGPLLQIAHSARQHLRMCEQRLAKGQVPLNSPDDHYNYAIALINQRQLALAEKHLRQALSEVPSGDHLYYALALCRGLGGDLQGAYDHLKRAVELQPRNRVLARSDPDFADLVRQSPIAELLQSGSARAV